MRAALSTLAVNIHDSTARIVVTKPRQDNALIIVRFLLSMAIHLLSNADSSIFLMGIQIFLFSFLIEYDAQIKRASFLPDTP